MKISGEYAGRLTAKTEDAPLIDRVLEVYTNKSQIKFYLFNSSNMNWHNKRNLLFTHIVLKGDNPDAKLFKTINEISNLYHLTFYGSIQL